MQKLLKMFGYSNKNNYLCNRKDKDRCGVATHRQGETDTLSLPYLIVGVTLKVGSMKEEQEIWKPVVGFEHCAEVSSLGRVRTIDRSVCYSDGRVYRYKSQLLKPHSNKGYLYINIANGNRCNMRKVHRLVAEAFIPNPERKPHIDHINTIKTDNRVENLRWVTRSENMRNELTRKKITKNLHSGLMDKMIRRKKEIGNSIKRVYQFRLDGALIAEYESMTDATVATGIKTSSISQCCNHKRGYNHAGGYMWSYSSKTRSYENPMLKYYHSINMYDVNHNFIRSFMNVIEASNVMDAGKKGIQRCCRGERKTYKGYIWRYADKDEIYKNNM